MTRSICFLSIMLLLGFSVFAQRSIVVSGSIFDDDSKSAVFGQPIILALDQSLSGQTSGLYSITYSNTFGEYHFIIPDIPFTSFPFAAQIYVYDGCLNQHAVDLWFTLSDTVESPVKFYITPPDSATIHLDFEQSCDSTNSPTYLHFSNDDLPIVSNINLQPSWKLNSDAWNNSAGFCHFFSSAGINTLQYRIIIQDSLSGFFIDTLSTSRQIAFPSSLFHTLGGNVLANTFPIEEGIAVLYRRYETILEPVDTMIIDTLGYYFFPSVPQCQYTVRVAAFIEDPSEMFLPTYLGNTLHWSNADHRLLQQDVFNANITLVPGLNIPIGSGSITAMLNPAPEMTLSLLLFDQYLNPASFTLMTPNGYAWFQDLPYGVWYIGFEEYGTLSTLSEIVLNASSPNAYIQLGAAASINEQMETNIRIWPNPASSQMYIHTSELANSWIICDLSGRLIKNGIINSTEFSIDLNDLPSGCFFLMLNSDKGNSSIPFTHL